MINPKDQTTVPGTMPCMLTRTVFCNVHALVNQQTMSDVIHQGDSYLV
jgi:hypothetical protein